MRHNKFIIKALSIAGACMLAAGLGLDAKASEAQWDNQGNSNWRVWRYFDFGMTPGAGHDVFPTMTPPSPVGAGSVKYVNFFFDNNPTDGYCHELSTTFPSGRPASTADTRFWVDEWPTSTIKPLDDDGGAGTYSLGRVYVRGAGAFVRIRVAVYNNSHNSEDFQVVDSKLNLTEAQCTTGQAAVPWVKVIGSTFTYGGPIN
jgi:hypothetical protein